MFEMLSMSIYGSAFSLLVALAASSKPYAPVDMITGLDSFVERPSVELDTSPSQWNGTWQRHKGITPIGNTQNLKFPTIEHPPKVDFDENEVLVVFGGLASAGGYKVVDSEKADKEVVVRLQALPLPGNARSPSTFKANPFAFVMFKKTKLPFKVELEVPDANGDPQWKTIGQVGAK